MSFRSGLSQRTTLTGIFFNNSTTETYSNTETNLSLLASLQYVQNFTNYFIYATYLPINNPTFQGDMAGSNITLSGNLSTPVINGSGGTPPLTPSNDYAVSFTGSPKIQNQNFENMFFLVRLQRTIFVSKPKLRNHSYEYLHNFFEYSQT